MTRLAGKVIIFTGATSGIGRASAVRLGAEGARVVVTGRREAPGLETVKLVADAGGAAAFEKHDVTNDSDWARVISATLSRWGRLDGLVNNAGECALAPISELTLDTLRFLMAVNVEAPFLGMKHAMPVLRAHGGGVILNVGSVAALRPAARSTAYAPTKAALAHMSKAAAVDGASQKPTVRVNMIHPGLIWSETVTETMGAQKALAFRDMIVARSPVGRVGNVEDIAGAIAYLVSDQAQHMTGRDIVVDGGLSLN